MLKSCRIGHLIQCWCHRNQWQWLGIKVCWNQWYLWYKILENYVPWM